jgi:hypothetical protein
MTTPDPALTDAFVGAFRATREARQRMWILCKLLAQKLHTSENGAHAIMNFVELLLLMGFRTTP